MSEVLSSINTTCLELVEPTARDCGSRRGVTSEPTCLDLDALYGSRFRLRWEADGVTRYLWHPEERGWLREILCRHGRVYPVGGTRLAAFSEKPRIVARLADLAGTRTHGSEEVRFDVADAEAVYAVMQPRRRRRLSAVERARKAEILARARRRGVPGTVSESDFSRSESTNVRFAGANKAAESVSEQEPAPQLGAAPEQPPKT